METKFNLKRISYLLKYELVLLKQPLLLGILGVVAFILAISAMASSIEPRGLVRVDTMKTIYTLIFSFGGAIITSFSFHRVSTKGGAMNYLSLPASREEKFLVIFLSTALAYPLGVSILFVAGQLLAKAGWMMTGGEFQMYNPFAITDANTIKYATLSYLSMHGFYFLGSILFKKYSFLKSTVAFFVISFLTWLVLFIVFVLIAGSLENPDMLSFQINDEVMLQKVGYIGQLIVVVFFVGLWGLSFLKFKKKEV
ncbi:hypothetical protein [Flammeovirga sp. SJP92]|uniref:hypothetical protein n=1 Tax=Flammeovirga sp. SJP92 TaxID=1775430 RepID=UPI000786DE55|nr:hypothetical protein [Flammeovirga sp. SJP92]KXX70388.1 hypothetical protein AVL50_11680 [Flammeovirga sp. SJP92]